MAEIFKRFEIQRRRNGLPNILFVITTGATSDGDVMKPIGDRYRTKGIKVWAYGVNPNAKKFVDELKSIATNPSYVVYGPKKSLVTPDRFNAVQELIKQGLYDYFVFIVIICLRLPIKTTIGKYS